MSAITYDGTNRYIRITDIDNETHELIDTGETSPADFSSKYLLGEGDLLFARTGASVGKTYFYQSNKEKQYFAGYLIKFHFKNQITGKYVFYFTQTKNYKNWVSTFSKRSGQSGINAEEYSKLKLYIPVIKEQELIVQFLEDLDKKLNIVRTKLAILKKYRKGLTKNLLFFRILIDAKPLNGCCKITTGKLDANAMKPDGKYKFFTCSKEDYLIDNYAFDCEAILVAGNGEVGYTKYYKGKFNAYQRTYVLYNFKTDPFLIKTCIDLQINSVIRKETNKGTMPYIKLGTFSKIKIPNIDEKLSCDLNFLKPLNKKIFILEDSLKKIKLIKQYLLKNLFI